eukprot:332272_1
MTDNKTQATTSKHTNDATNLTSAQFETHFFDKIKSKLITFGYIHRMEFSLNSADQNQMSIDIINICVRYYGSKLIFNPNYHGDHMSFINDNIVNNCMRDKFGTCIFGEELRTTKCNKFNLYIKWKQCTHGFIMGFITSNVYGKQFNWNGRLGSKINREHSVGILVNKTSKKFSLWSKNVVGNRMFNNLDYCSKNEFKQGDIFILSFNIAENKLMIFHNGSMADQLSLDEYTTIIPAFTLWKKDEEIEIVKYQFY